VPQKIYKSTELISTRKTIGHQIVLNGEIELLLLALFDHKVVREVATWGRNCTERRKEQILKLRRYAPVAAIGMNTRVKSA